jgi:DNA transformation protein
VGIQTEADLEALGAVEAYRRVKAAFPGRVSLNLLWGLQGALLDLPWNELPPEMKEKLKREVDKAG